MFSRQTQAKLSFFGRRNLSPFEYCLRQLFNPIFLNLFIQETIVCPTVITQRLFNPNFIMLINHLLRKWKSKKATALIKRALG